MARTWSGVIARLGVPTGDGRILAPGGMTSRDLPLPLLWQEMSSDGHGGARVVGRIETMAFGDGMVTATGTMLDSTDASVIEQLEAGVIGPSVDLDDVEYQMDDAERIVITQGRIAGATLVAIPAFADVNITLDPLSAMPMDCDPATEDCSPVSNYEMWGLTASVRSSGWSDMPIADEGRAWDGTAAANRVFAWATDGDTTDWGRYARAFLRKDDDANPETRGAYGFGIADVIDGTLTIVPRGVFAAAAAVQGARTGSAPEDAEGMKRVLRSIYERMDRDAPFSMAASATAALPPAEWFDAPDVDRLTPLTVSDTGRVFGHIAAWGQCHVGMPGCVTPPSSQTGYAYFHQSSQRMADGSVRAVGTMVAGPRHADPQAAFHAATAHYDDPSAAVAKVVAGQDDYGIWVAGWIPPTAKPEAVEIFKTNPVSGDWRRIGGNLEMIAVCSVNSAGFPIPRAQVSFSNGAQRTLIGSFGIIPAEAPEVSEVSTEESRARWAWANRKGR